MKANILYTVCAIILIASILSCSNDNITIDNNLDETLYDPETDNSDGSIGAAINDFYNNYGSKILYKFKSSDLFFGWSSTTPYWYVPVKDGSDEYIKQMISYIKENICKSYPAVFTKKYLPYRIFFVDSICNSSTYNQSNLVNVLSLPTHGIVISHIGTDMANFKPVNWNNINNEIITIIMNSVYNMASSKPVEFENTHPTGSFVIARTPDPLGEFSNFDYALYSKGLVNADRSMPILFFYPSLTKDFSYYLLFIFNSPKTLMDKIFNRFPLVKQRTKYVVDFIINEMEMDPIEIQNSACPNDPLPKDYFDY
jgi:hypothetical protein